MSSETGECDNLIPPQFLTSLTKEEQREALAAAAAAKRAEERAEERALARAVTEKEAARRMARELEQKERQVISSISFIQEEFLLPRVML